MPSYTIVRNGFYTTKVSISDMDGGSDGGEGSAFAKARVMEASVRGLNASIVRVM